MKIIKVIFVSILFSSFFMSTVDAAKENFDRSKAKADAREKGSGMATGKRQHKPMQADVDDDCDGLSEKACMKKMKKAAKKANKDAKKKAKQKSKGKATDYNSSRSNKEGVMGKPDDVEDEIKNNKNKFKDMDKDMDKDKKRKFLKEK